MEKQVNYKVFKSNYVGNIRAILYSQITYVYFIRCTQTPTYIYHLIIIFFILSYYTNVEENLYFLDSF